MSASHQNTTGGAVAAPKKHTSRNNSYRAEALVCTSDISGPFIGGRLATEAGKAAFVLDSDLGSEVEVTLVAYFGEGRSAWLGFVLGFQLPVDNEVEGFGVRYRPAGNPDLAKLEPSPRYNIVVSSSPVT